MADTILGGDFTIYYSSENGQKRIKWTGSPTGTRTVNELYSAIQKLFDDLQQLDDKIPIRADTPDIYRIINQWFIDDDSVEHLTSGSLFTSGWVDGTNEHVLIIGADFNTAFSSDDIGRTVVGGTTGDTGTLLDFNSARGLLWIRPDDPSNTGDQFDNPTETYAIQNASAAVVWQVDITGPTFVDQTSGFNDATDANYTVFPATEATGDYAAFGFSQKFSKLVFDAANGTAGTGGTVTWEYWNGAWTALSGVTDGTTGFTAGTSDGQAVTWTAPSDWVTTSLNGSAQLYYVRAVVGTTYTVNPVYDQGFVGGQGAGNFIAHPRHGGASVAGESAWAGITSIGSIQDNTRAYIFQESLDVPAGSFKEENVIATKGTEAWWPREGHLNMLLKTKEANSVIGANPNSPTSGISTFFMRQYSKTYSHFIGTSLATSGGNTVVPFGTSDDLDNTSGHRQLITDAATGSWTAADVDTVIQEQGNTNNKAVITSISGTSPNFTIQYYLIYTQEDFADNDVLEDEGVSKTLTVFGAPTDVGPAVLAVTPTFGATTEDINNGNGARPYSVRINPASNALADVYERLKYLTRRGSSTLLLGQEGQEYLGNELQVQYNTQAGGNFVEGAKVYDQTTNAQGIIVADHDDGTSGDLILKAVRGTFTNGNVISLSPSPSQTIGVCLVVDTGGTITDETADAISAGTADVTLTGNDIGDYFVFGALEPFERVVIDNTGGTAGIGGVGVWEYWNGSAWTSLESQANFSDGTSDFTAATGVNNLDFDPPLAWEPHTLTDGTAEYGPFWMIRFRVTTAYSTNPVLDQVSMEDLVTATINGLPRTIVPVAASPFGTFAGGKLFAAPGVTLTTANLASGEEQSYQLIDDDGNTQTPPNTVSISVDNLVSGDSVAVFRRTGTEVNRTQLTLAAGNNLGDTTVELNATLATDNPTNTNSKIRVVSLSNEEHRYRYSGYSGTTVTLSTASTGTDGGTGTLTTIVNGGATFVTDGVEVGDMVRNTTDGVSYSIVVSVDGETTLTVTSNGVSWASQAYSVNTLVENYNAGQNAYIPLIERIADATSEGNQLVFTSSFDIKAVVRRSNLSNPIIPFEQDTTLGGNTTVTAIRTSDDIIV